jgi:hypothetical protein
MTVEITRKANTIFIAVRLSPKKKLAASRVQNGCIS